MGERNQRGTITPAGKSLGRIRPWKNETCTGHLWRGGGLRTAARHERVRGINESRGGNPTSKLRGLRWRESGGISCDWRGTGRSDSCLGGASTGPVRGGGGGAKGNRCRSGSPPSR